MRPMRPPNSNGSPPNPAASAALLEAAAHFDTMIDRCIDFATEAKASGRFVAGILCEFAPRELILAANGVPVCLCGGSAAKIPVAEQVLPANLCPLIKSTFGYHLSGENPFLEMADLVVAESTCDGKKKMAELMGQSRPMVVLPLPHQPDHPEALDRWTTELRKFKAALEERFGKIPDAKLAAAINLMNRERGLRRRLADFMTADRPPLTGRQLLEFKSIISGIESDLRQYEILSESFAAGGALPGSPRAMPDSRPVHVLMTGVPMVHGAERVIELIEGCGGIVVCMENCTGLKPILEDVEVGRADLLQALAEKYLHLPCSVMSPNRQRFDSLRTLARKFRPECVIELVWQACLTYDIEACHVRRLAEDELGLPYLKITTDYSPGDSARLAGRVEALFEVVRSRPPQRQA